MDINKTLGLEVLFSWAKIVEEMHDIDVIIKKKYFTSDYIIYKNKGFVITELRTF